MTVAETKKYLDFFFILLQNDGVSEVKEIGPIRPSPKPHM